MKQFVFVFCLILFASCGEQPNEPKKLAIVGARLVDGTGAAAIEHSIVIVEAGKIAAVGPQTSVPLPKDAEIVDGLGRTIEPPKGSTIRKGDAANLTLGDAAGSTRTMVEGKWQK